MAHLEVAVRKVRATVQAPEEVCRRPLLPVEAPEILLVVLVPESLQGVRVQLELLAPDGAEERRRVTAVIEPVLLLPS